MDKYPSIYLIGFALAVIKDILVNKKQKKQNIKNDVKADTKVQNNNLDVEIGSYPFFHAGKLGVSIVIRSEDQNKIDNCN